MVDDKTIELCISLVTGIQHARGLYADPHSSNIREMAKTWAKQLQDLPHGDLIKAVKDAWTFHGDNPAPFGVPQIKAAYKVLCEERRDKIPDSVKAIKQMRECEHDWQFFPEPLGTHYSGFNECSKCQKALPVKRSELRQIA